jgi:hypothetical protein
MVRTALSALLLTLAAPLASATEITVTFAPKFEETLAEDYGVREGERLVEEIREDITRALEKSGVSPARIDVTLIDAKPNRPTFKQLGDEPGLDFARSISIGGASLEGVAYDASGAELARVTYKYYESDIRNVIGYATWTDADRASARFASKLGKALVKG